MTCCADGSGSYCPGGENAVRVTYLHLYNKPGLRGTLEDLSDLDQLHTLHLYNCAAVTGEAT